jgi:hypothetical protein
MDSRLSLSKEHGGLIGNFDGHFLQIVDLKPEHIDSDWFKDACAMIWEAFYFIQEEDFGEEIEIGVNNKITKAEAKVWNYFNEGCRLNLAYWDGKPCGVSVWQPIYFGLVSMRILYVIPELRDFKLGQTLGGICGARRFLYQTRKQKEPSALLKHCLKFSSIIYEDDHMVTYLMNWERE